MIDILFVLFLLLGFTIVAFWVRYLVKPEPPSVSGNSTELQKSAQEMARELDNLVTRHGTGDVFMPDEDRDRIHNVVRKFYGR